MGFVNVKSKDGSLRKGGPVFAGEGRATKPGLGSLLLFRFLHILVKYRSSIYTPSVNILRVDWLGIYTFVKDIS
jgi:hypothetical protein